MKQDSTPNEDTLEEQRQAAREDARQRVEEGKKRRAEQERIEEMTRPRPPVFTTDSVWYDVLASRLGIYIAFSVLSLAVSIILWLAQTLRWPFYYLIRSLDVATGGRAIPFAPWLMWAVWGGVFGGCLGYWLVEPIYGDRENRSFALLLPLLAMAVSGALLWAFVR